MRVPGGVGSRSHSQRVNPVSTHAASSNRPDSPHWHLALVLLVSAAYESLFIGHWINGIDEGWPLYAAMRMHAGGTLYADVFFVFPPGHVLPAWIAYALDPPGVTLARILYAAFSVALCGVVTLLARRLMVPGFALMAGLLVAVAAPASHETQLLFGYRYLVWSALAVLAFSARLRGGGPRWIWLAGVLTGVSLVFRLTPAFAAAAAIGVGLCAAGGGWRRVATDAGRFAAGLALVAIPTIVAFSWEVGLDTLWREVVVRPLVMTDRLALPAPSLAGSDLVGRDAISAGFVAILFRLCIATYLVYALVLGLRLARAWRTGAAFDSTLLLCVVVWGGVYFLRALGRSDEPHLSSAIPPFCLIAAHALSRLVETRALGWVPACRVLLPVLTLGAWIFLLGSDRSLDPDRRGATPLAAVNGAIEVREDDWWRILDPKSRMLRRWTEPGDVILDLSATPLFHVLSGRLGPGAGDMIVAGTFLDAAEERAFLDGLRANPPAVVILPERPFDERNDRAVQRIAPRVWRWVEREYRVHGPTRGFRLLIPRDADLPGVSG
jgi:hypothetical protein